MAERHCKSVKEKGYSVEPKPGKLYPGIARGSNTDGSQRAVGRPRDKTNSGRCRCRRHFSKPLKFINSSRGRVAERPPTRSVDDAPSSWLGRFAVASERGLSWRISPENYADVNIPGMRPDGGLAPACRLPALCC